MSNYVEYIILPTDSKCDGIIEYNFNETQFAEKMTKLTFKNIKFYERKVKQYLKDDLYYEVILNHKDEISDIRSYTKIATEYVLEKPNVLKVCFEKHKKPIHAFSSSYDMHDIVYIKRLTFRVSNRVFVNFETGKGVDDTTPYRKVYINANFDGNVDVDFIQSEILQYVALLS